ncbi:MAG: helix-turn-helix transcriptional regulator [Treponema sp.]|nr:helix-turn-helix transcriptional regulator [Treponema sp.]
MATFKENLRNELDFQGLTVKELSARTGIIKGSLDNYLGVRSSIPPADVAVRIADALNVTVEYLVTGADKKIIPREHEKFMTYFSVLNDYEKLTDKSKKSLAIMIHALAIEEEKEENAQHTV